ncbi:MAG TPA: MlaD family protein [Rudaea sp.]|nr:MlaD family protein [Rudaea sp.]
MKRDNLNYVLVGAVMVAAFVLLIATLVIITGRSGASTAYYTHYHDVAGLRVGAPVFYQGYRIGEVGKILPQRDRNGTRYKVEMDVRRDWPIPKDSLARMTSTGLLADVAIGIGEGKSTQMAAAGSELTGVENADIFSAMSALAGQLSDLTQNQLAPMLKDFSTHLNSIASTIDAGAPELMKQSSALLLRLNKASDALNDALKPGNRAALSAILANAQEVTTQLRGTQQKLDEALGQLASITTENRPGIRDSVENLRSVLAALSGRIDSISQHLEVASRNFDEFAREVRKSPNRLLIAPKADKLEEAEQ